MVGAREGVRITEKQKSKLFRSVDESNTMFQSTQMQSTSGAEDVVKLDISTW